MVRNCVTIHGARAVESASCRFLPIDRRGRKKSAARSKPQTAVQGGHDPRRPGGQECRSQNPRSPVLPPAAAPPRTPSAGHPRISTANPQTAFRRGVVVDRSQQVLEEGNLGVEPLTEGGVESHGHDLHRVPQLLRADAETVQRFIAAQVGFGGFEELFDDGSEILRSLSSEPPFSFAVAVRFDFLDQLVNSLMIRFLRLPPLGQH